MPSHLKVAQELRPVGFGLTDEDYVRVQLCFIGHQSHMRSPQYDRDSPLLEPVCHGIDVRRARGMKGNRDQIGVCCEIDRLDRLIDMQDRPMRRHEGG
jgi:hypothetical protein